MHAVGPEMIQTSAMDRRLDKIKQIMFKVLVKTFAA